jgi:predicted esterase
MMTRWVVLALVGWAGASEVGDAATQFLEQCRDGKFAEAIQPFDATMAKVMPGAKLKETWQGIVAQFGALKSLGTPREESLGAVKRVKVRCEFEKTALDAIVAFDPKSKIAGFFLVPAVKEEVKIHEYFDPSKSEESEVTVGAMGWPLKGTLTRPKGVAKAPLVVLVHGSGPQDRDEAIGPNAPFRDLARGLASRGVASLRYEKRTKAYAEKLMKMPAETVTIDSEVIDDTLAALAKGWTMPGIDSKRVYLLGHSLGGTAAPEIAQRDGQIAGLILMAASARPLDTVTLDQLQYLADNDPSRGVPQAPQRAGGQVRPAPRRHVEE